MKESDIIRIYLDSIDKAEALGVEIALVPSGFRMTNKETKDLYGQVELITEVRTFLAGLEWGILRNQKEVVEEKKDPLQHVVATAATCGCDSSSCSICIGGLSYCMVCGCTEGSLPTHCPGVKVPANEEDKIYLGVIDFRDGKWVDAPNPTNQAMQRAKSAEQHFSVVEGFPEIED